MATSTTFIADFVAGTFVGGADRFVPRGSFVTIAVVAVAGDYEARNLAVRAAREILEPVEGSRFVEYGRATAWGLVAGKLKADTMARDIMRTVARPAHPRLASVRLTIVHGPIETKGFFQAISETVGDASDAVLGDESIADRIEDTAKWGMVTALLYVTVIVVGIVLVAKYAGPSLAKVVT